MHLIMLEIVNVHVISHLFNLDKHQSVETAHFGFTGFYVLDYFLAR